MTASPAGTSPPRRVDKLAALRRRLSADELSFSYSRSSGPGGQNVNKVNTRVTLLFNLAAADALTEAEKRRIRTRLPTRVTRSDHLRVVSSRHRTQRANRCAAIDRLYELLADALDRPRTRKPTRMPPSTRARRLRQKRIRGDTKRLRGGRPADDGD